MPEFTVIGFLNEEREPVVAGVVEGSHAVTQDFYDRWFMVVEADTPGKAEEHAEKQMYRRLSKDQ